MATGTSFFLNAHNWILTRTPLKTCKHTHRFSGHIDFPRKVHFFFARCARSANKFNFSLRRAPPAPPTLGSPNSNLALPPPNFHTPRRTTLPPWHGVGAARCKPNVRAGHHSPPANTSRWRDIVELNGRDQGRGTNIGTGARDGPSGLACSIAPRVPGGTVTAQWQTLFGSHCLHCRHSWLAPVPGTPARDAIPYN